MYDVKELVIICNSNNFCELVEFDLGLMYDVIFKVVIEIFGYLM